MITLYNTLSRELEPFTPLDVNDVRFFVCGPTVYGPMHLGHAKTYSQFDLISRVLKHAYPTTRYAMNITDIDDKIINKAVSEDRDPIAVAREWETKFWGNMATLGNNQVTEVHRAHDHIEEVIDQVARLLALGKAYSVDGEGVYFDLSTFTTHGRLAQRLPSGEELSRVDDTFKRNPGDFVLWKFPKTDHEPRWDAPFGVGRPGWHIEDTAITEKHLGSSYDIHGGATDLIFPHHEAEIAQMEAITGEPLVGYWLHTGLLSVDGKKMGKSLNNFVTVDELLNDWDAKTLRYAFVSTHYRSTMEVSERVLFQAENSRTRVENFYRLSPENYTRGVVSERFVEALYDDFNTPQAFADLFVAIRTAPETVTRGDLDFINELLGGVFEFAVTVPVEIVEIAESRLVARQNKDWNLSDSLRDAAAAKGWSIRDYPGGYEIAPL